MSTLSTSVFKAINPFLTAKSDISMAVASSNSFLGYIYSVHWGINPTQKTLPPLFCHAPLLRSNCPILSIYFFLVTSLPPLKIDFSVNPHNIRIFHP